MTKTKHQTASGDWDQAQQAPETPDEAQRENEKALIAYYKRKAYGGRNALARALDFIVLRAVLLVAIYLILAARLDNSLLCGILSIIITLMASIILHMFKKARWRKRIKRYHQRLRIEVLLSQMLLLPQKELMQRVKTLVEQLPGFTFKRAYTYYLILEHEGKRVYCSCLQKPPKNKASEDDILYHCRKAIEKKAQHCLLLLTCDMSDPARALRGRTGPLSLEILEGSAVIALCEKSGCLPDDQQIEAAIYQEIQLEKQRFAQLKHSVLVPHNAKRYFFSAAIVMLVSFLTPYGTYYIGVGVLLAVLGAIAFFRNQPAAQPEDNA